MWRHVDLVWTDVPPKCWFIQDLYGATSQNMAFFIVTAMKTSNLLRWMTDWRLAAMQGLFETHPFLTYRHLTLWYFGLLHLLFHRQLPTFSYYQCFVEVEGSSKAWVVTCKSTQCCNWEELRILILLLIYERYVLWIRVMKSASLTNVLHDFPLSLK
jgi:hypothetical protein